MALRVIPVPARAERPEMLDRPGNDPAEHAASLADVRTFNRRFGGHAPVLSVGFRPGESVLDVGTGSGDLPELLGRRGVRAVGLDLCAEALDAARRFSPDLPVVLADGGRLPFRDGAFDVVVSSLTLHHLDDGAAVRVMREMRRVARRAALVNDLERGYLPAALAAGVTRAFRMHPYTRHDAPLSVLKGRTPEEYRALADAAGWTPARVRRHPFWRVSTVWEASA